VLLLTGQRPGEVFKMRWAHLDLEARWWEMPESATKNRVAHRVPLTERVFALLEEAKAQGPDGSRWVFAGIKGGSVAARALQSARTETRSYRSRSIGTTCDEPVQRTWRRLVSSGRRSPGC
jgi:integrase